MAPRTKVQLLADRRSREVRRAIGNDFRRAREDQGISARRLAGAAGIDPAYQARIEAGAANASIEVLQRLAACLGGDLGVRYFAGTGSPLRDRYQAPIVEALLALVHRSWKRAVEVPVHRPARGVIDVVLVREGGRDVVAVEVHSQIRRLEQLIRWSNLKRESLPSAELWQQLQGGDHLSTSSLLIVRSTAATRAVASEHAQTVSTAFPAATEAALASLREGRPWPGPTLLWADIERGVATLRDQPPRGVDVGRVRRGGER